MPKRYHESRNREMYDGAPMRSKGSRKERGGRETESKSMQYMSGVGMIQDDWNAPALLPREVIDKNWPSADGYRDGHIKDLFDGVNSKLREDNAKFNEIFHPGKY